MRSLPGSYTTKLCAAVLPLLALLLDLVGSLQAELFWREAAAVVLGGGCLAFWLTLPARVRPVLAVVGGLLLLASLAARVVWPPSEVATALLAGGVAWLLASRALVEGLARDDRSSLVAMLESWEDEAADAAERQRPAA